MPPGGSGQGGSLQVTGGGFRQTPCPPSRAVFPQRPVTTSHCPRSPWTGARNAPGLSPPPAPHPALPVVISVTTSGNRIFFPLVTYCRMTS